VSTRPPVSQAAPKPSDPYDALGETARRELDEARSDPRLKHNRPAAVADFWAALNEAERVRTLAIRGAHAIRDSDPNWALGQLAAADIDNDFPGLNAQALVAMNNALDSMIEEFAPAMRDIILKAVVDQAMKKTEEEVRRRSQRMSMNGGRAHLWRLASFLTGAGVSHSAKGSRCWMPTSVAQNNWWDSSSRAATRSEHGAFTGCRRQTWPASRLRSAPRARQHPSSRP
jgi:hypothetical protein